MERNPLLALSPLWSLSRVPKKYLGRPTIQMCVNSIYSNDHWFFYLLESSHLIQFGFDSSNFAAEILSILGLIPA